MFFSRSRILALGSSAVLARPPQPHQLIRRELLGALAGPRIRDLRPIAAQRFRGDGERLPQDLAALAKQLAHKQRKPSPRHLSRQCCGQVTEVAR